MITSRIRHFKSDIHTVTVKGFVEKEVKADQVVWTLRFRRTSDDLKDAHAKISADRETAISFLLNQGFKNEEIGRQPTQTIDKLAREYGQSQAGERLRYIVTSSLLVKTTNVDLVIKALGATEELLKSGIVLDGGFDFIFTLFKKSRQFAIFYPIFKKNPEPPRAQKNISNPS